MSSTATSIVENVARTLRASGLFAAVSADDAPADDAVPSARVGFAGQEHFASDDRAGARWVRLWLRVTVRVRADLPARRIARAMDLCAAAAAALLVDPFRGELCRHLPVGAATEIGAVKAGPEDAAPVLDARMDLRCHYECEEVA